MNHIFKTPEKAAKTARILRLAVIAAFAALASGIALWPGSTGGEARFLDVSPQTRGKYSKFSHNVKAHEMACSNCHKFPSDNWNKVRAEDTAFPDITDYPKHQSCVGCHKQQFFKGSPPEICSICHTNPSPRDSSRHPFPNPRELFDVSPKGKNAQSAFEIFFPHDKHIEIVTALQKSPRVFQNVSFRRVNRAPLQEESCSVCHQTLNPQGDSEDEYAAPPPKNLGEGFWLKKGTFKSAPIGHTVCFTCHVTDSGLSPEPDSCSTCHRLKRVIPFVDFDPNLASAMKITDKVTLASWSRRDSSAKFRHEWFSHSELSCSTCHNVGAMDTLDPATKRVGIEACAMCHVTPTADDGGALNFEADLRKENPGFQCVKCHAVFGKLPMPKSHSDALAAASGQ